MTTRREFILSAAGLSLAALVPTSECAAEETKPLIIYGRQSFNMLITEVNGLSVKAISMADSAYSLKFTLSHKEDVMGLRPGDVLRVEV